MVSVPESIGLGTRSTNVRGQEKTDFPAQSERQNSPFLCLFVVLGASMHWMMSTHIGEGGSSLFSLLNQMLISCRNPVTDTLRNNVSPALQSHPCPAKLTQTTKHHMYGHKTGGLAGQLRPLRVPVLTLMTQRCIECRAECTRAKGRR